MPKVSKWKKLDFSMKNSFESLMNDDDDDNEEDVTEFNDSDSLTAPQPTALLVNQAQSCLAWLATPTPQPTASRVIQRRL